MPLKPDKMRRVEREAQERVRLRVREIVHREFGRELRAKEEEAEEIERRLVKVRKALHAVRYGAVARYYSARSGAASGASAGASSVASGVAGTSSGVGAVPRQTRSRPEEVAIHPATRCARHICSC